MIKKQTNTHTQKQRLVSHQNTGYIKNTFYLSVLPFMWLGFLTAQWESLLQADTNRAQ